MSTDEVICILDRSGSMSSIADDAIGGFNSFLEGIREEDSDGRLTLVLFDHEYDVVHRSQPLADVPPLSAETFVPRGMTALYDAIGQTLTTAMESYEKREPAHRPPGVTVAILTDGHENSSREYTNKQISALIERAQREHGWTFIFLAANQDAFESAESMGMSAADAQNFDASSAGVRDSVLFLRTMVTERRQEAKRGDAGRRPDEEPRG